MSIAEFTQKLPKRASDKPQYLGLAGILKDMFRIAMRQLCAHRRPASEGNTHKRCINSF